MKRISVFLSALFLSVSLFANQVADFVAETTDTIGTGTLTLNQVNGFARVSDAFSVGEIVYYSIKNGINRETGIGTVGAGNILQRTTPQVTLVAGVYDDSAPLSINLTGSSDVYISATADLLNQKFNIPSGLSDNQVLRADGTNAVQASPGFFVDNDGNVGIGTPTPARTLHLEGAVSDNIGVRQRIRNSSNSPSTFSGFEFGNDTAEVLVGMFLNSNSNTAYAGGNSFNIIQGGPFPLTFATNNQIALFVDGAGNVGINNNTPSNTLDVGGNTNISGTLEIGSSGITDDYKGALLHHTSDSGGGLFTQKDGGNPFVTLSGWDHSNGTKRVHVGGGLWESHSVNEVIFYTDPTNPTTAVNGGIARMTISKEGITSFHADKININTNKTPTSSTDTCTAGDVFLDSNYIYFCHANNTIVRGGMSTW